MTEWLKGLTMFESDREVANHVGFSVTDGSFSQNDNALRWCFVHAMEPEKHAYETAIQWRQVSETRSNLMSACNLTPLPQWTR